MSPAQDSSFGERLKRLRRTQRLTQEELARRAGYSPIYISMLERGARTPVTSTVAHLAEALRIPARELMPTEAPAEHHQGQGAPGGADDLPVSAPSWARTSPTSHLAAMPAAPVTSPLPRLPSRLIGRDESVDDLSKGLCPGCALALHGLPGVGKTTLASALAHHPRVRRGFPDGVLWAGLGRDPNGLALLGSWGTALGLGVAEMATLATVDARARALRAYIGDLRLLLVLDDVWRIEDALALRVGGPGCAHVLTTRFPEIAVRFADVGAIRLGELSEEDGLLLLGQLAPEAMTAESEQARALVRAVGGLPLALTLMGHALKAQVSSGVQPRRLHAALERLRSAEHRLTLAEPVAPVDRPPSLPVGSPLSLQAAIALSVAALSATARAALGALAVFPPKPNTFTEAAALFVADAPVEALDALADVGLLEYGGVGRYMLHQTIADFARPRALGGTEDARFAEYYVVFMERVGGDYAVLERERVNLLAALEVADRQELRAPHLRGTCALSPYLIARGLTAEAEAHLVVARRDARALDDEEALARTWLYLGQIADLRGYPVEAVRRFEEGIRLARATRHVDALSELLNRIGETEVNREHWDDAEAYLVEGLRLARELEQPGRVSMALRLLGEVADSRDQFERGDQFYRQALRLAREHSYFEAMLPCLQNLGAKALQRGDYQVGERYLREGLAGARAIGDRRRIAAILNALGLGFVWQVRYTEAEDSLREALEVARALGAPFYECRALGSLGLLERTRDHRGRAQAYLREGLKLARTLQYRFETSELLTELGWVQLAQRRPARARVLLDRALELARALDNRLLAAPALFGLAQAAADRHDNAAARRLAEEALAIYRAMRLHRGQEVGQWLAKLPGGDTSQAARGRPDRAGHRAIRPV